MSVVSDLYLFYMNFNFTQSMFSDHDLLLNVKTESVVASQSLMQLNCPNHTGI